jgi:hypothetical protein
VQTSPRRGVQPPTHSSMLSPSTLSQHRHTFDMRSPSTRFLHQYRFFAVQHHRHALSTTTLSPSTRFIHQHAFSFDTFTPRFVRNDMAVPHASGSFAHDQNPSHEKFLMLTASRSLYFLNRILPRKIHAPRRC